MQENKRVRQIKEVEIIEEYAEVDGELRLLKRKKTKKDIPPDLKAVQLLLESREERDISLFSDEELKIKTFFERVNYDKDYGLDATVNKWIANNKNMIEIIDIQINGLYYYGPSSEYSVIMITYKELNGESK